jgi:class 3 adenylate cyclase/tetratricopeptide (TPR) repeat protein
MNRKSISFCEECGSKLDTACPSCGATLPPGRKFCGTCGEPLDVGAAATRKFASPESYTPKHLAEKILTSKATLEGERKQVTVLFADLKGSMELLADRDPEDARKLLDPVLEHMMEAIHRYEGTVNQVMGDGIMALFGAPLAHEDHAVRACYAALRMQESVTRYAEGVRRQHGVTIRIRVGLNSGEVVVRAIGSDLHMDYTAVGQTTHLAARMEQLADPGSILLAPDTLSLAEGFVQVTPLGPMAVKGLPAPVEVYELAGVSALRSRLQAAAARGLSRFVGRDAEIEHLRRALEQAGQGRGQIAAVVGEPGVGKSRLVFELTHSHRVDGWLVLESSSVSYGKATSYLPVIDLLKGYFKVHDRETHREVREKVTGKVLTLDRALEPTLPALLALLDVPGEDPQWQAVDPPQRRRLTLDAVKRLLLRESQLQPLLVIFEDLHWIDSETQALLDSLVESLPPARLLLLVNYRPEYQHGWGSKTYYTQLRLDALPPESANELLQALLGTDATVEALKPVLIARTGGNPLFLEESVRTLAETHALTGERGAYRLARPLDTIDVPATVQAILASRIDRLAPEDKQLLQTASVIGKDVPFALLQAIAGLPEDALRRGLAHLQDAEFLYETSLFPDLEYTFKHALTHEVAYSSLLRERRRALHARIVDAIEALHRNRLDGEVERLAHHAFRGELWERAAEYSREAGARAFMHSANRAASVYIEQALDALKRLPETPSALEASIDLRFELRNAIAQTGTGYRGLLDHLSVAETLARALGDRRRLGRALDYQSNYWRSVGDLERATTLANRALAIAEELRDVGLGVAARFHLGMAYSESGDYRRAGGRLIENVILLGDDVAQERFGLAVPPAVLSRIWLAWCLAEQGEFHEGIKRANEARHLAEHSGRRLDLAYAIRSGALVYLGKGDLESAVSWSEELLELSQADDLAVSRPTAAAALGYARALSGRFEEARSLLEEALNASTAMGVQVLRALFVTWRSEVLALQGLHDEAEEQAQHALTLSREGGYRGHEAWALRLLGELAVQREPSIADASTRFREALMLAEELGMRPLIAHCHLGLGRLYRKTGKRDQAREHLTTATTMYREMDMRFWLEQVKAEMQGSGMR